jgi:hypothetical protein
MLVQKGWGLDILPIVYVHDLEEAASKEEENAIISIMEK